ncbi:anaphase promoting complex subunit protein [Stemphylium lycopersici]|uniref:Anaphase promoting complex subunit protein n=1 Tax=Stemphylium lycopersici TaxID=183478 RepID=A0A364MYU2_STELY|nr:anaphase promoting complex subunit protein [Stemphylium lycopersici]
MYTFFAITPLIYHTASYELKAKYDASNFFDKDSFQFYDGWDIFTKGLALYLPKEAATSLGIARIEDDKVYLGADTRSTSSQEPGEGNSRKSIRIEGTQTFDNGLFVADFDHLPSGCGVWPAFWLLHDTGYQEDWYSEFDIVEGASLNTQNQLTLHTGQTHCLMRDAGGLGTTRQNLQCSAGGKGCGVEAPRGTFGREFNAGGSGIWAAQVEADGIKAWFFAREDEPADLNSEHPDPKSWPNPVMNFVGDDGCSVPDTFKKMKIIINITFCGANAGEEAWSGECSTATNVDSCARFVAMNPEQFEDVYFAINSVRVFQRGAGSGDPEGSVPATSLAIRTSNYDGWPSMTTEVLPWTNTSTAGSATSRSSSAASMMYGEEYEYYSPASESSQAWSWSSTSNGVGGYITPSFGYSTSTRYAYPPPAVFAVMDDMREDSTTTLGRNVDGPANCIYLKCLHHRVFIHSCDAFCVGHDPAPAFLLVGHERRDEAADARTVDYQAQRRGGDEMAAAASGERRKLSSRSDACVIPRPIGWISTLSPTGTANLAPYSQFNNLTFDPPYVMFSANQVPNTMQKDTVRNVEATGKFVWNLATYELREQVNISAVQEEYGVDEFVKAGLEKEESTMSGVRIRREGDGHEKGEGEMMHIPMVKRSPIKFECEYYTTLRLPGNPPMGSADVVIGRVVGIHIDDGVLTDGKIDVKKTEPIARCGYYEYAVVRDVFEMKIPGQDKALLAGLEGSSKANRKMDGMGDRDAVDKAQT